MTALEDQREDQALGAAWRRMDARLKRGDWNLDLYRRFDDDGEGFYLAATEQFTPDYHIVEGRGQTPELALTALADALEARR